MRRAANEFENYVGAKVKKKEGEEERRAVKKERTHPLLRGGEESPNEEEEELIEGDDGKFSPLKKSMRRRG